MWPSDNKMQAFKALSYVDQWRVSMCLWRGEAPGDLRLAAAAVDLAEGYRRQGRVEALVLPWYPLILLLLVGYYTISLATSGDLWVLIPSVLVLPIGLATLVLDPRRRPQNMARSLEASKRMLPADWKLGSAAGRGDDNDPAAAAGWYADPHNRTVQRLWDGESWTTWVRPRSVGDGLVEADPAGWQPHPSRPGREILWSGDGWTDRESDSVEESLSIKG